MGNKPSYELNTENLVSTLTNVIKMSKVPSHLTQIVRVHVGDHNNQPYFMNTILVGDPASNLPKLVVLHGFGSSGGHLFKIYKRLSERFTLYFVDMLGMGASDRPDNFNFASTAEQCIDYFMIHFERWRHGICENLEDGLTDFYLAGHSYGAYLACHFANRYPHHVRRLVLISPLGVGFYTDE